MTRQTPADPRTAVERLLAGQTLAVLATSGGDGPPHASLVAFAVTPDLATLIFATPRRTRKYDLLQLDPRVALLIDDRTRAGGALELGAAVTVIGTAREVSGAEGETYGRLLAERHAELGDLLAVAPNALMAVRVERFRLVRRFGEVVEVAP